MAQDTKQGSPKTPKGPQADSVDREPTDEVTPEQQSPAVDREDGPKGHPTSDRFQTEQANKTSESDAKGS